MSTHNEQQLLNTCYNNTRQLRADHDDLKARVENLVTVMTTFKNEAQRLLEEMAAENKPQESNDRHK